MAARSQYLCDCGLPGHLHQHDVEGDVARARGIHSTGLHLPQYAGSSSELPTWQPPSPFLFASSLEDSIKGALLGMHIGDALSFPLHWIYSWGPAQEQRAQYVGVGKQQPAAVTQASKEQAAEAGDATIDAPHPAPSTPLTSLAQQLLSPHMWPAGPGISRYSAVLPHLRTGHPDSSKYFLRCNPAEEPYDCFGGAAAAALWSDVPSLHYHAFLPAGGNTLNMQLNTLLLQQMAAGGHFDAEQWGRAYEAALKGRPSPPQELVAEAALRQKGSAAAGGGEEEGLASVPASLAAKEAGATIADQLAADTWIDETHRVFLRNRSLGAEPWEAGMSDCCLAGIAAAAPLLLAYYATASATAPGTGGQSQSVAETTQSSRQLAEQAVRSLLQLTHKSEDMVEQAMWFGDLLRGILDWLRQGVWGQGRGEGAGAHTRSASASDSASSSSQGGAAAMPIPPHGTAPTPSSSTGTPFDPLLELLESVTASYSKGKLSLHELCRREAAGPEEKLQGSSSRESSSTATAPAPAEPRKSFWGRCDEAAFHGPSAVFSLR